MSEENQEPEVVEIMGHQVPIKVAKALRSQGSEGAIKAREMDIRTAIKKELGEYLGDVDDSKRAKDLIGDLKNVIQDMSKPNEKAKTDMEHQMAELKANYERQMSELKASFRSDGIYQDIRSLAVAKGLKEEYQTIFNQIARDNYRVEQDGDRTFFRDKQDELIYEDSSPASPKDIERKIRERFPDLYKTVKTGLGTSKPGTGEASRVREGASASELMAQAFRNS